MSPSRSLLTLSGLLLVLELGCAPVATDTASSPALESVTGSAPLGAVGRCAEVPRSYTHQLLGGVARAAGLGTEQRNAILFALPERIQRFILD